MRTHPFYYSLLILLFSCVSFLAKAQESIVPGISYSYVEKLVATAQKNFPAVMVKTTQTAIAKNNITKVAVGYLDAFTLSYYYRPNNAVDIVNPNFFNGYQFGVNVNLGTLIQKPFAVKEAKGQYKVAELEEKQYLLLITENVKERYFAYLEQVAQLKLRTKSYTDAESLSKQLKYKFERGETTLDDYQRAVIMSTEQNQSLIHAESGVFTTKAALEELLGDKLENIK